MKGCVSLARARFCSVLLFESRKRREKRKRKNLTVESRYCVQAQEEFREIKEGVLAEVRPPSFTSPRVAPS